MFLRIEGFQVEIKEINKTWNRADFIKNFKIGTKWNNIFRWPRPTFLLLCTLSPVSAKSSIYNLEGLKPNTFYHVRSKSRNKAGLSDASNIIYLHTTGLNAFPRLGITGSAQRGRTLQLSVVMASLLIFLMHSRSWWDWEMEVWKMEVCDNMDISMLRLEP